MGSDKRAGAEVCRERKALKTNRFDFKMPRRQVPPGARITAAGGRVLCVCVCSTVGFMGGPPGVQPAATPRNSADAVPWPPTPGAELCCLEQHPFFSLTIRSSTFTRRLCLKGTAESWGERSERHLVYRGNVGF